MRCLLALLLLAVGVADAQTPSAQAPLSGDTSPHSSARLVADAASAAPGDAFEVALVIEIDPGWHIYWQNPGDSGQPTTAEWSAQGATVGDLRYPVPSRYDEAGLTTYAHSDRASFVARVDVDEAATGTVRLAADARWLICADVCVPATASVTLDVPVGETALTGALDDARDALPTDAFGWTASAAVADGGYLLTVAPPDGVSLDGAHFFVDQAAVLDHGAEQRFRREGDVWAVRLSASDYATDVADRLGGVLAFGGQGVTLDVPVADASPTVASASPTASGMGWLGALAFAFLGGLILNLMPCVFPILGIKVLGFVNGRDDSAAELRAHGLMFGAGVVVSFLVLAGGLLALRAAGAGLGWGFQLQSPPVVAGLAVLMTGLALNLLGVFSLGEKVASATGRLDRREGLSGSFLSGVLAVIVATPCTAPFMGAALGFAIAQPAALALVVFATLGVGMALPYVLLSFRPSLVRRLPRPGPWMETLKQGLAFPLLATAVWLVWVFGLQTDVSAVARLLLALVLVGLAAWAWGSWPRFKTRRSRTTARAFALAVGAAAVGLVVVASGAMGDGGVAQARAADPVADADGWQPWSADGVEALVADGTPVFVDFTAAWCLTCQVNKQTVLSRDAVRQAFADGGVVAMRADWTNEDPAITEALAAFGRSGVPLYVLYPPGGGAPTVMEGILSTADVVDAVSALSAPLASR